MPPTSEYSRLVTSPRTSESEDVELLPIGDSGWLVSTRPKVQAWLSESTAWNAFTLSLILALAISAVNLTVLSARNTLSRRYDGSAPTAISPPVDYPSVYIGLERVAHDPSQCLNRMTFPNTFYIYDARKGPNVTLTHVHAPEDEVTLVFGGPIRAIMEIHILDFGLENCTFVVQTSKTTHLGSDPSVDVYLLPLNSKPNDGQDGDFLDRLAFIPGRDSISRPFYCPSRSRVLFELRCSEDDCIVQIALQGVTSKTATVGHASVVRGRTGFRVDQYQALACIARS